MDIIETRDAVSFYVRVQTRASSNCIAGQEGRAIKVKLTAPPVEGEANRALVELLSDSLDIKRSDIRIINGLRSRNKTVKINGLSRKELLGRIGIKHD